MVYDEAKQAHANTVIEQDVQDRFTWEIENAERREKKSQERIKNDASSDWALLDELTDVYALRAVTRYQRRALERIGEGVPVWKVIDDLVDRVTEDIMNWRGARSSSRGSNAISEETQVNLLKFRESLLGLQFKTNLTKPQD